MKVIERATMPDGTPIQLEDWRENNTPKYPNLYGFEIGAYPIASKSRYFISSGRCFRLSISRGYTEAEIKADYEALKGGNKTLIDLAPHFWNPKDIELLT